MIDFDELIERHIYRCYRQKEIGRYYPSEVGSCIRKVWYSYKYPKEISSEKRKIYEAGNIMHDFVAEVLRSEKNPEIKLLQSEMPVKTEFKDFTISGRVDDVILVETEGKKYLIEIKSSSSLMYIKMPQAHNVVQLQYYMYATGIHNGIMLYIEKNTLKTKAFEVKYDEKIVDNIIKKLEKLHQSLKNNSIPEAEAKKSQDMRWMCNYCEYQEECSKNP